MFSGRIPEYPCRKERSKKLVVTDIMARPAGGPHTGRVRPQSPEIHDMKRTVFAAVLAGSTVGLGLLAGWSASSDAEARELAFETRAEQRVYTVDLVHSSLVFKIRHAGIANFYGRFNDFSGETHFDAADPTNSRFDFTVQTASVDTGNKGRDDHLRNADFFNSRQFPTITFESTGVTQVSDGVYEITGDLTMQGETREVTARLTDIRTGKVRENDALGYEATFSIKRGDFGMTKYLAPDGGEDGGLGNTVDLIVAIEAVAK
jgi:polyisoprenoid-binding protein YceI